MFKLRRSGVFIVNFVFIAKLCSMSISSMARLQFGLTLFYIPIRQLHVQS